MNIPYDPTLVLGHLADDKMLRNVQDRKAVQAQVEAAENRLNALICRKRSIDMRIQELIERQQNTVALCAESAAVGEHIEQASVLYAETKIGAQWQLETLKMKARELGPAYESPLDANKSRIRKLSLTADALKMQVQYFAFEDGEQRMRIAANAVRGFVNEQLQPFGEAFRDQAGAAIHAQLQQQYALNNIAGTLVISLSCLHRNALQLLPFALDADKALRVWNTKYPHDPIDTDSLSSAVNSAATASDEHILQVVSAATYGSCCIGLIHLIDAPDNQTSDSMYAVAEVLHGQFEMGGSFSEEPDGWGVDAGVATEAMSFLKSSRLHSLCSTLTLGATPQPKLANLPVPPPQPGIAAKVEHTLAMPMMIAALDNYVQDALAGQMGTVIEYALTPVTKEELVARWIEKYQYFPVNTDTPAGAKTPSAAIGHGPHQQMGASDFPGAVYA